MATDLKKLSLRQEQEMAADLGGRTTAGSGAARFSGGGDVRTQGKFRGECKLTTKDHYNLKLADLTKLQVQALRGGLEQPLFQLAFVVGPRHQLRKFVLWPERRPATSRTLEAVAKQIRLDRFELERMLLETETIYLRFPPPTAGDRASEWALTTWERWLALQREQGAL